MHLADHAGAGVDPWEVSGVFLPYKVVRNRKNLDISSAGAYIYDGSITARNASFRLSGEEEHNIVDRQFCCEEA